MHHNFFILELNSAQLCDCYLYLVVIQRDCNMHNIPMAIFRLWFFQFFPISSPLCPGTLLIWPIHYSPIQFG